MKTTLYWINSVAVIGNSPSYSISGVISCKLVGGMSIAVCAHDLNQGPGPAIDANRNA